MSASIATSCQTPVTIPSQDGGGIDAGGLLSKESMTWTGKDHKGLNTHYKAMLTNSRHFSIRGVGTG